MSIYGNSLNDKIEYSILNEYSVFKEKNSINIMVQTDVNRNYGKDAYFKIYNHSNINQATKCARICIFEPRYIIHDKDNSKIKPWILNKSEKDILMKILVSCANVGFAKSASKTVWASIIDQYINFGIPSNLPLPDYTKL